MKKISYTENAPKPVGPYSQALLAGKFLFVSGQLAIDPKEGKIVATNITGQTIQVLENIKAILKNADHTIRDIVQTNVYLSSMSLFRDFNSVYATYFGTDFPARATVAIEMMSGTRGNLRDSI